MKRSYTWPLFEPLYEFLGGSGIKVGRRVAPVNLLQHNADGTFTELATHHEVVPEGRESEDIDEDINEIPRPRSPRQPDFPPPDYKEAPWKKSWKE